MTRSTVWKRLRLIQVAAPTDAETLARLVRVLEAESAIPAEDRSDAASYLRRLADNPKALAALNSYGRGRPISDEQRDVALDYLVCRTLLGPRRSKAARSQVAVAWGLSEKSVQDAYTNWKQNAAVRLRALRVLREDGDTRRDLEAIHDDLQDIRAARRAGRNK